MSENYPISLDVRTLSMFEFRIEFYANSDIHKVFADLPDFCVATYGSVSEFLLETEQSGAKSDGFDRRFTPKV